MNLLVLAAVPFAGALLVAVMIRAGRVAGAWTAAGVNAVTLAGLLALAPAVWRGVVVRASLPWAPSSGLSLDLSLDPLGLFFGVLILGIGLLVVVYTRPYLAKEDPLGRFLALLLAFQGAMLLLVLADNLLLVAVAWELTSLASFLLIGFWGGRADARQGARTALVVTGGGGLALLGGVLLLGQAAGTFSLAAVLAAGPALQAHPLHLPALLLILLGCLTKSAQLPFHWWLPRAMAAPTPVSAYLHSATLVQAGVFLLMRLWPVFAGGEAWVLLLTTIGLATMVAAAAMALACDDLKALLAYSTVSHLGLVVMLLGLSTPAAAVAAVLHTANHATFKATLFLATGMVEHGIGTRDARQLGGLRRVMPVTAGLSIVAAAAMAGLPFLNGFWSKELMLEAALHARDRFGLAVPALATLGAALSAAYAWALVRRVHLGPLRLPAGATAHEAQPALWLPVAVLALPVLILGLAPQLARPWLAGVGGAVTGLAPSAVPVELWHGFGPALGLGLLAIGLGLLVPAADGRLAGWRQHLPSLDAATLYDRLEAALHGAAATLTTALLTGSLPRYLAVLLTVGVGAGWLAALEGAPLPPADRAMLEVTPLALAVWLGLVGLAAAVPLWQRDRLTALLVTSFIGLLASLAFVQFSAPDLALTQISADVVTTVLLLLALTYLPARTPAAPPSRLRQGRDVGIALAAGLGVAVALLAVLRRDGATIADGYVRDSLPRGGGGNVVNVILVDFRGFDTLGEITVLAIAALAVAALLESALQGVSGRRLAAWQLPAQAAEAHPLLLTVATRVVLPFSLIVAVHLFLRGHDRPGGGFIAGLAIAIALLVQYMASGYGWAERRLRVDYHGVVAAGVLVAGGTGLAAMLAGRPFLTSAHGYLDLPWLGRLPLASAIAFDLGVLCCVVGVVMLALAGLARIGQRAERARGG